MTQPDARSFEGKARGIWKSLSDEDRQRMREWVDAPMPADLAERLVQGGLVVVMGAFWEGQPAEGPPYMPQVMRALVESEPA